MEDDGWRHVNYRTEVRRRMINLPRSGWLERPENDRPLAELRMWMGEGYMEIDRGFLSLRESEASLGLEEQRKCLKYTMCLMYVLE